MPCGKEQYIETSSVNLEKLSNKVMKGELFGFLQVDIHILDELIDKFSEFCPFFFVDTIRNQLIPLHMKECQKRTRREKILGTQKLLGEKILLYTPLLKWHLSHGLKVTIIHKYLKFESGKPFEWFPEEVSQARQNGDSKRSGFKTAW